MSREVDVRDLSATRMTADREAELRSMASEVSDRLPGAHRVRIRSFDAVTGNAAVVASAAAPAERGNYVNRALAHMQRIRDRRAGRPGMSIAYLSPGHRLRSPSGDRKRLLPLNRGTL